MLNEMQVQQNRGWINTTEPNELMFWMDQLHADADMLKDAIDVVGPSEDKVREHLYPIRIH